MSMQPVLRFKTNAYALKAWDKTHLSQIAKVTMGQSPSSDAYNEDYEGLPLIQGNADIVDGFTKPSRYTTEVTKRCQEGDVILSVRAPVGELGIATEESCIGRGVCAIRASDKSDTAFIYQLLQAKKKHWKTLEQGSTFTAVSGEDVKAFEVAVPTKEEQQKIAAFFTVLDEKIKIQKDVIEILILQREQFLRDFFSRKIGFCEKFGLKSTDWVSVQLKDICEIKTGPFGSLLHAEDYVQKGIPIVTTEHFKKGSLPLVGDGIPQVSLSDSERLSSYKLETGDIVFSRVGSVDINALVEECHSGWLFSGRVLRVRCNESVDARFLHYALSTNVVKKDIIARAVGLTMASINTSILEETKVEIPVSQKEQEFIGEFMNFLDKRITIKEQQLNELVRLKRAFMQQMFV